jgi:endonuclease YncB( thermonuclease family)
MITKITMKVCILGLVLSGACAGATPETRAQQTLAGSASVIDGDTIEIHGQRIRLSGFDTPERGSRCGKVNVYQSAALALSDFIGSRTVTCEISGQDRFKRSIGTCSAGGEGLADYMVEVGWGRDWPRYSGGTYAEAEQRARSSKSGIWGLACPDDLWGERSYD